MSKYSTQSIYDFVGSTPERGSHFAEAMAVWASRPDYSPLHVINGYDWAALFGTLSGSASDGQRVRIVDVGGAQGHVAMALAQKFPFLEIVVQDMGKVIEGAEAGLPEDLKNDGRVRFMAHDLFAPQPLAARVFFFRWILHNWADKYCIAILRAHIAVLGPGVHIIIMDTVMPEPGENTEGAVAVPLWVEKDLRYVCTIAQAPEEHHIPSQACHRRWSFLHWRGINNDRHRSEDLNMGAVFNARERTLSEWKALFIKADARFVLTSVNRPKGSTLSLMAIEWRP